MASIAARTLTPVNASATPGAARQQDLAFIHVSPATSSPEGQDLTPNSPLPAHQALGQALGWDYAHHGLTPPVEHLYPNSPLRQGWLAGAATFGARTLPATIHTQRWLALRSHAWARGRSFELVQLTPNFLQQIDSAFCPILRQALNDKPADALQKSIDRVRDDAGYAAGNLVNLSRQANAAKASHDWHSASALASSLQQGPIRQTAGLDATQWARIATLCSFVTALPHEEAARIPLHVLPPNRLRLFNPIQALQALVTRQLARPGWSQRLARIEALLPSDKLRGDFNRFVLALAPRVLAVKSLDREEDIRWALEDAWSDSLLQRRWTLFALQLSPAQAEALVQRAAAKKLSAQYVQSHCEHSATEGWALEYHGYCPAAIRPRLH
ncbi:hypothetical protein C1O66_15940 [Paucibacter aquatile]|uniref:Uncharacterized protein n=1 Tax=Kinneretia aquatilis TaxID=2070761 RepID=A0A2N8KZH6_9BURK|nr:hypothetical protein [Paucibacter aquatile]PND38868.1 hypothetical protein C1O66_15940 [Paucibacter aquatile]